MLKEFSCELLQKAHVSGVKQADVADAVLHHRDAIDSHAKGEPGNLFRVIRRLLATNKLENSGVDHAAAQKFNPAGMFAFATAFATAEDATDLYIGTRFSEGKERWEEPCAHTGPKQLLH